MTFEQKLQAMLISNGMFATQANEVLQEMKDDESNEPMKHRWDDDIAGYPEIMLNVLWLSAKVTALAYLEKNMPKAWFKPMFMEEKMQQIHVLCERLRTSFLTGGEMTAEDHLDQQVLFNLMDETGISKGYIHERIFGEPQAKPLV